MFVHTHIRTVTFEHPSIPQLDSLRVLVSKTFLIDKPEFNFCVCVCVCVCMCVFVCLCVCVFLYIPQLDLFRVLVSKTFLSDKPEFDAVVANLSRHLMPSCNHQRSSTPFCPLPVFCPLPAFSRRHRRLPLTQTFPTSLSLARARARALSLLLRSVKCDSVVRCGRGQGVDQGASIRTLVSKLRAGERGGSQGRDRTTC